jgi:hypothetical protein
VIIDGQAFIYAKIMQFQAELYGTEVTEAMMEAWQDEWKQEAADLVGKLVKGNGENTK